MSDPMPDRVRALAASVAVPEGLTAQGLLARFGRHEDVDIAAGQVWRARWEHTALIVMVLATADHEVTVAPVTVEPTGQDERSLLVGPELTVFGVDVSVWAGLAGRLPIRVLDQILDQWPLDIVRCCHNTANGIVAALPAGVEQGREPDDDVFDASVDVRAGVADDMELLAAAPGLPVADPAASPPDLRSVLGLSLTEVMETLDVHQAQAMSILRGTTPLTGEQVQLLAERAGAGVEQVAATARPLPGELVREVEHPRTRPRILALAARRNTGELEARLIAGYGAMAMAARQTGVTAPQWQDRLHRYFEAELRPGEGD